MPIAEQIRAAIYELSARHPLDVPRTLRALTENVPGVSFGQMVVHRSGKGNIEKLDVTFIDEIHDPTPRTVSVDLLRFIPANQNRSKR